MLHNLISPFLLIGGSSEHSKEEEKGRGNPVVDIQTWKQSFHFSAQPGKGIRSFVFLRADFHSTTVRKAF